ncbi:MAG: YlxR family protein [Bdellovibrionales bacterium]|nr:YlxR family protein [Bdellovibrionales bacterium]
MVQRTCVVCRGVRERSELLRFVIDAAGAVRLDVLQQLPGRGAYCCAAAACFTDSARDARLSGSLDRRKVKRRERSVPATGASREAQVVNDRAMLDEALELLARRLSVAAEGRSEAAGGTGSYAARAHRALEQLRAALVANDKNSGDRNVPRIRL